MKIGFDISQTGGHKTGCGFYADTLIRHLLAQHQTDRFLLYPTFGNTYWEASHHKLIKKIDLPNCCYPARFGNKEESFRYWGNLQELNEKRIGSPDIVHSNNFSSPRLQQSKLVYTIYDLSFIDVPECTTEENRYLCFNGTFLASMLADMIIAISHHTKKRFLENFPHFPKERVVVSHLANRLSIEGPETPVTGLSNDLPFLLAVGTLEPRKNLRRLLSAYQIYLARSETPKHLVLAGSNGWLESDLPKYISDLNLDGKVHVLGYVSDATLRWLYKSCWAFIYPSIYEGFGLPVLEAMSAGAATITSNTTSLPEVGGDAALYVNPFNEASILSALLRIDDTLYRQAVQDRCKQQAKLFDWSLTASTVYQAYQEVLELPHRRCSST